MFNFCVEYGVIFEIELIELDYINDVYECVLVSDVCYCFVIDILVL